MRRHATVGCLVLLAAFVLAESVLVADESLFHQSVAKVIERHFPQSELSYILVDAARNRLVSARWQDMDRPIPIGSLAKPFIALAYAEAHGGPYPTYMCRGTSDGCWLPRGHGELDIRQAIAQSCNRYFAMLASKIGREAWAPTLQRLGIAGDGRFHGRWDDDGEDWRLDPITLTRAFRLATSDPNTLAVADIRAGLALAARDGTAQGVSRALAPSRALAKTGTAPCVHERRAPGDGYVIVLYPANEPRYTLLVQLHGQPGSHAATMAGQILRVSVARRGEP